MAASLDQSQGQSATVCRASHPDPVRIFPSAVASVADQQQ